MIFGLLIRELPSLIRVRKASPDACHVGQRGVSSMNWQGSLNIGTLLNRYAPHRADLGQGHGKSLHGRLYRDSAEALAHSIAIGRSARYLLSVIDYLVPGLSRGPLQDGMFS